jgi:hypothetical protein
MENITGKTTAFANTVALRELLAVAVQALSVRRSQSSQRNSAVIGVMQFTCGQVAVLERHGSYWRVGLWRRLPTEITTDLINTWGKYLRVEHSPRHQQSCLWHVDSLEALHALVQSMRDWYGAQSISIDYQALTRLADDIVLPVKVS